eukprot:CAMPEP_0118897418 /NCGR_PEP_ID=MMETSP1166-20130328/4820_1 /TAXON_ID=1104430 /ORGANISM="Chrysoreinhardia sp, Strain CCMP3193" /LENGTH=182 /DNA_ID=CAMNT_0006836487 /DNA_START=26 /DNA_END=574 /DNA_ORIENTATION=-
MKLKHHEKKLLRKVDLFNWKGDNTLREAAVLRRYHVSKREDYVRYNRLVGMVTSLVAKLKAMKKEDGQRHEISVALLRKLYGLGVVDSDSSLAKAERVTVSSFCRRRLPVVMVRLKMAETVKDAVAMVETANVRCGPNAVTDPAFLVTRTMEDYVTWVDDSKIKRHIAKYHDKLDDFDLLRL